MLEVGEVCMALTSKGMCSMAAQARKHIAKSWLLRTVSALIATQICAIPAFAASTITVMPNFGGSVEASLSFTVDDLGVRVYSPLSIGGSSIRYSQHTTIGSKPGFGLWSDFKTWDNPGLLFSLAGTQATVQIIDTINGITNVQDGLLSVLDGTYPTTMSEHFLLNNIGPTKKEFAIGIDFKVFPGLPEISAKVDVPVVFEFSAVVINESDVFLDMARTELRDLWVETGGRLVAGAGIVEIERGFSNLGQFVSSLANISARSLSNSGSMSGVGLLIFGDLNADKFDFINTGEIQGDLEIRALGRALNSGLIDVVGFEASSLSNSSSGVIVADDGGLVVLRGGLADDSGEGADLVNRGMIRLRDEGGLVLSGTLTNTGVVSLESTGGLTSLVIQGQSYDFRTGELTGPIGAELRGGGTILLSDNAANLIRGASPVSCPNFCVSLGAARLTNFDNVIEGAGTIGSLATRQLLEFYNYGVVNANASTPLRLVADGVNGGTMMASDGGTLIILGSYDNRGGTLKAVDGGTVMSRSIEDGGHASIVGTSSRIEIDGIYSSEGGSVTLAGGTLKATDGIVINDGTLTGWGALAGGFSGENTHVLLNDTARTLEAKQGFVQNGGRITFLIEYDVDNGFTNSAITISDQYLNIWDSTQVVFRFGENANPESFWSQGRFVLDSFVLFESDSAFARRFSAQRIAFSELFVNNDFVIDAQSYSVRKFKFDPDIGVINLEIGNVSAIPEPGVWLQLIAGFLTIGLMVRRGRHRLEKQAIAFEVQGASNM